MASQEAIAKFLTDAFPHSKCSIIELGNRSASVRYKIGTKELRPGGTVSGPVQMIVADVAPYVALLGEIGLVTQCVTSSMNINFLRRPAANKDLIGICKLIKVGKTLGVGEVNIHSEGDEHAVAHAVGTYSIPPRASA